MSTLIIASSPKDWPFDIPDVDVVDAWDYLTQPKYSDLRGVRIVNLLTQEGGYGHGARPGKASLKHVRDALRELSLMIAREGFSSLALPRLATGVGELTWDDVRPLIFLMSE